MKKTLCSILVALALAIGLSGLAAAQETTGNIVGTVKDSAGAAIAGATVTVSDPTKGNALIRTVTTTEDGVFSVPDIKVSTYTVTVEAPNFKKSVTTGVIVDVGKRKEVSVTLQAGNISEIVTVSAGSVGVELSTPQSATTINGDQVKELQINNRNFVQLVTLSPGVTNDLDDMVFTGTRNPENGTTNRTLISVNGARSTQNTFTVDGADITDRGSNLTIQAYPSIESIGEFQILRSLYPAESGRGGGGQINVITRSGTDKFHGSAFEFVRNEALNASDFLSNRTPSLASTLGRKCSDGSISFNPADVQCKLRRRPFRYDDFGFTVGGPVYFLKLGDWDPGEGMFGKMAKTYFFFSQENRYEKVFPLVGPGTGIVPDANLKQGIFPVPICLAATGTTCNSILPAGTPIGTVVPVSHVAQAYISQIWNNIPNPNNPAAFTLTYPDVTIAKFNQQIIRIDHTFTNKFNMFYRYERDSIPTQDADGTIGGGSSIPFVNRSSSNSPGRTHTLQGTYAASSNLIFEGRYTRGFGAIFINTTGLIAKNVSNIPVNLAYPNTRDIVPTLSISGFNSLTGFGNYNDPSSKDNFTGNTTWITGNHTFKFGVMYSRYTKMENALGGTAQGSFSAFGNSVANGSVLATGVTNNALNRDFQSWANFMQGNLVSFSQNKFDLTANLRQKAWEGYAQDEYRLRRNITLYLGVRYSFFGLPWDKNGQLTNFDPALFNPAVAPQVTGSATRVVAAGTNFCNGLIINSQNTAVSGNFINCNPTVSPWGKYIAHVQKDNFAPRFGISWDPFGKGTTAIRTGFGIYHEQIPISAIELFLGQNPPFQETFSLSNTTLDNPTQGLSPSGIASTTVQSLRGIDPDFKTPYMEQWSLDIQHQFGKNTFVSVGYYGSRGAHLIGFTELNDLPVGQALKSLCATGTNTVQTPGATLVQCQVPGTAFTGGAVNTQLDQIRPFRGYRSIDMLQTRYNSNYHSLQIQAQHRFSGASQVNFAYTWSHNLTDNQSSSANISPEDSYNIHLDYGPATLDRRHVVSFNYIYELPFFRHRHGLVGNTLGGWQVSGIASYYSGLPFTITTSSYDPAGLGFINSIPTGGRPNILCDPNSGGAHTFLQWFNTACFQPNPAVGATGLSNTVGNAPRGVVLGPPTKRVDFALAKNFHFGESYKIQLRGEAFNVLNHTNFRALSTNVTSASFGQVTSVRDPRTLQLGIRFEF